MSLAHNGNSQFADSNTSERDGTLHKGLSPLGRSGQTQWQTSGAWSLQRGNPIAAGLAPERGRLDTAYCVTYSMCHTVCSTQ